MADETVEIKITGDSSDLAAAMADVAKRVELLIDALSATAQKFEEVGKDAEKGFGKVKKATDKAAGSTKKLAEEADKAAKSTATLRQKWESAADQVGRADSAFSAISSVLDQMNPKWAEFSRLAADAAAVSEQLILAITQSWKMFTAMTIVVTAAIVAYEKVQKPFEEMLEKHKALGEAWDRLGKSIANQAKRIREYRQELNLLNGVETKAEQNLQKRMDDLKVSEKQQQRRLINLVRKMKNNAKDIKQQERASKVLKEGIKNIRDRIKEEESLIVQLNEHARATEYAAEAERVWNGWMQKNTFEMLSVRNASVGAVDVFKVYEKELSATARAGMSSADAFSKMAAGLALPSESVENLSIKFARQQEEMHGLSAGAAVGTAAYGEIWRSVKDLNKAYKESTGISRDMFVPVVEESFGVTKAFGAINVTTGQTLDIWKLLNLAIAENLKIRRQQIAEEERMAAATRAWVNERNALLESLQNENAALDATLTGPFRELEQAYEAQMEDLDEIIDKYEKSAKSSQKSAAIVSAAEEQKALKTIEFSRQVTGLLEEENRKREKDRIDSELAMEKVFQDIQNVSKGREAETFDEKLALLSEHKEEQMRTLKDLQDAAVASGAEEVDVWRAVLDEKQQINAEYEQGKAELEEERREQQRQKRAEDIQLFSETSTMLLQGASDAFMAIAENADQMTTEQRRKMFYISQAAAMGEIAISGMVAIANIWEEYAANPIAAGIMSAGMAGITAAQIATVASQEPSFDIGGVIKGGVMANSPDQVGVNVLPGESVLNRSATERLGEQGVNALNSGKGMGQEIIVVPAYRHFDRFIKDEYRKGGAFRRFFNDAREYPVGHRSY